MDIKDIQEQIKNLFGEEDHISGPHLLTSILAEETGELSAATRGKGDIAEEAADVIFITLSIANLFDADVSAAFNKKYLDRTKKDISSSWNDVSWKKN